MSDYFKSWVLHDLFTYHFIHLVADSHWHVLCTWIFQGLYNHGIIQLLFLFSLKGHMPAHSVCLKAHVNVLWCFIFPQPSWHIVTTICHCLHTSLIDCFFYSKMQWLYLLYTVNLVDPDNSSIWICQTFFGLYFFIYSNMALQPYHAILYHLLLTLYRNYNTWFPYMSSFCVLNTQN